MENKKYILNPEYILRNDKKRILLYSTLLLQNRVYRIHPVQAMILTFFSHSRSLNENIRLLKLFLGKDNDDIFKIVSPFINNERPVCVKWKNQNIWFPEKILIPDNGRIREKYSVEDMVCESVDLHENRYFRSPITMTLMLTNHCLTKCIYCYADKKERVQKKIETSRIIEIIQEAKHLNVRKINIIGGEVFLHRDWDIILKGLIDNGYSPEVISTKIPITIQILEKVKNTGYENPVQISLDSTNPNILSKLLKVEFDYWDKMRDSLALIDNSKIKYQITTILTNLNDDFESILKLYKFLSNLKNIDSWRISPAWNSLYIDNKEFENIKSKKNTIEKLFKEINEQIIPDSNFSIFLDYSFLNKEYFKGKKGYKSFSGGECSALQSQMFVLPDGQVTICEQLYWKPNFIIGSLVYDSIENVWNSDKAYSLLKMKREYISEKSSCKSCTFFDDCFAHRCWVDVVKAYSDENWDYPDPRCSKAPEMQCNLSF